MTLTLLACSPDPEFVNQITVWSDQDPRFKLIRVNSYEEIPAAIAAEQVDVVLLDNANGEIPLISFTRTLVVQQPGIKVMVNPSPIEYKDADLKEFKEAGIIGWFSKPFSPDEINTLSSEGDPTTSKSPDLDADTPEEDRKEPLSTEEADMGFLKGWMIEESPAESLPETKSESGTPWVIEENKPTLSTGETLPGEADAPVVTQGDENEINISTETVEKVESDSQSNSVSEITPEVLSLSLQELVEIPAPAEALEVEEQAVPPVTMIAAPPDEPESETQPASAEEDNGISFNVHTLRLPYCCILIPRDPHQYLTRDIAERLGLILPQIHLNHGWRVTGMSVRPLYLQWNLDLPVQDCPTDAINEVRQLTSLQLFSDFPELQPADDTRDFWAPGYLMLSGSQPFPPSILQSFIERTRNTQQ